VVHWSGCQPNAAPLIRATSRASSLASSSVAARIRISAAIGWASSHARARRNRLWLAEDVIMVPPIARRSWLQLW
jgi:hypothetical protein